MRKVKVFKYDHAPAPVNYDSVPAYRGSIPFSGDHFEKHCELVGPDEAELFLCGQYRRNQDMWKLHPNRFEYFKGNEGKHVYDLEGDFGGLPAPKWMDDCLVTAMNAEPSAANAKVLVRPGCSMLLMELVKNPPEYQPPTEKGFYFCGQRDPHGLREKVAEAFHLSKVPGEWSWTSQWNAPSPVDSVMVQQYVKRMLKWSFALCPGGTGMGMTCRFFEACALGRIPVVVADNWLFGEEDQVPSFRVQARSTHSIEELAALFDNFMRYTDQEVETDGRAAHEFFLTKIKRYFDDPTLYFIEWARGRGYIEV